MFRNFIPKRDFEYEKAERKANADCVDYAATQKENRGWSTRM